VDDGFFYLQNHTWSEVQSENDFTASVAVAKMILQAAEHKPDIILKQLADTPEVFITVMAQCMLGLTAFDRGLPDKT
jgi:hypothetical protein